MVTSPAYCAGELDLSDQNLKQKLIVVDDEPVILELLRTVFADAGYELTACENGNAAIRAMETQGVDVLLTDKNLPDVGGLELVRRAKEIQPDCEALILTGYASLDTALKAMELDVFDYILKPPKDVFDIKRKVHQAFEKQRVLRENRQLLIDLHDKNTELETALEQLKKLQEELIQSEKLAGIGTLAAGVAHEISSPLFGILGLAEAIGDEESLELVHQYSRDIVEYSKIIKDIVVDLTGYSRTAEMEFLTTVDVAGVINDAIRLVGRSLNIQTDQILTDCGTELFAHARSNELQQVFVNLIKNAVEAVAEHRPDGKVRICARREEDSIVITVDDDGPGIEESQRSVLFDPFFTTKAPGKGTGLGLNIVYRIVTKYRGSIKILEGENGGARFAIRFPCQ